MEVKTYWTNDYAMAAWLMASGFEATGFETSPRTGKLVLIFDRSDVLLASVERFKQGQAMVEARSYGDLIRNVAAMFRAQKTA